MITSGPLKGIQFVGPNGTPAPFNFGNVSGSFSNGGDAETAQGDLDHLAIPLRTFTFFGYGSYRLTGDIPLRSSSITASPIRKITAMSRTNSAVSPSITTMPISIPASWRPMAELGIATFQLGTTNVNNMGNTGAHLISNSLPPKREALGIPVSTTTATFRGVFNLDGAGGSWSWNAYYQHGLSVPAPR